MCKGNLLPHDTLESVTWSSGRFLCFWISPLGWISCSYRKQHLLLHQNPAHADSPPGFVWRMLVCLCTHTEIMKWHVKGLGQMNWQDRGALPLILFLRKVFHITLVFWWCFSSIHRLKYAFSLIPFCQKRQCKLLHIFCCFPTHFPQGNNCKTSLHASRFFFFLTLS